MAEQVLAASLERLSPQPGRRGRHTVPWVRPSSPAWMGRRPVTVIIFILTFIFTAILVSSQESSELSGRSAVALSGYPGSAHAEFLHSLADNYYYPLSCVWSQWVTTFPTARTPERNSADRQGELPWTVTRPAPSPGSTARPPVRPGAQETTPAACRAPPRGHDLPRGQRRRRPAGHPAVTAPVVPLRPGGDGAAAADRALAASSRT